MREHSETSTLAYRMNGNVNRGQWFMVSSNTELSHVGRTKELQEQLSSLFKALMHPARLAILDVLRNGEQCVCHIEAQLGYRQAYISQQLAVLRESGLIQDTREGLNIYYRVARPEVFAIIDVARTMVGIAISRGPLDRSRVECPCPKCATADRN
jgi:DNA-binding transcriptional ArsR family regulator